jgi:hypothetical protein
MSDWYIISDFEEFIDTSRLLVFNSFGSKSEEDDNRTYTELTVDEQTEIDKILSYNECEIIAKSIVRKQVNKKTNATRYIISDKTFTDMINSFNERMVSNLLQVLVNKGLIETAYDSESNDFLFYVPDHLKYYDKPETD